MNDNTKNSQKKASSFPYEFVPRPAVEKSDPGDCLHHALHSNRFDVAFEVNWRTLSPTALNPCVDHQAEPCNPPDPEDNHFKGNDRRWLMSEGRLAISPFSIKSAVADVFAALLGGCFRVVDQEVKHESLKDGQYPYTGAWKRYRAARNKSLPALIQAIDIETGAVTLQPVTEFYYDASPPAGSLVRGEHYHATTGKKDNKDKKLYILGVPRPAKTQESNTVTYYGPYKFGMNMSLKGGQLGKRHYHRFYKKKGKPITGSVPKECFLSADKLKKKVYMGALKPPRGKDPRSALLGGPWHENLADLKPGDWVYCQPFDNKVVALGKSFQFKALFRHIDTLPPGQEECVSTKRMCPRCAMFGLANHEDENEPAGFRSRFKSSALINELVLEVQTGNANVQGEGPQRIQEWTNGGKVWARQVLLPVLGPPKANKRDVGGYYNARTGLLKGAKVYKHACRGADSLEKLPAAMDNINTSGKMSASPGLRSWAMVCDAGLDFKGTLGAENCSAEEFAALCVLLDSRLHETIETHGYKMGLGKAFGLGSVVSTVHTIWVRHGPKYAWKRVDVSGGSSQVLTAFYAALFPEEPKLSETIKRFAASPWLNRVSDLKNHSLEFPAPGHKYWK